MALTSAQIVEFRCLVIAPCIGVCECVGAWVCENVTPYLSLLSLSTHTHMLGVASPPLATPESSASVGETAEEPRGEAAGGFAAYRRAGFTAATKRADKARRATGAGRGKARDVSRRRRHPTTAAPPRWTRPFRRDSGAAPRQGAKTCAAIGFRPAGKRGLGGNAASPPT